MWQWRRCWWCKYCSHSAESITIWGCECVWLKQGVHVTEVLQCAWTLGNTTDCRVVVNVNVVWEYKAEQVSGVGGWGGGGGWGEAGEVVWQRRWVGVCGKVSVWERVKVQQSTKPADGWVGGEVWGRVSEWAMVCEGWWVKEICFVPLREMGKWGDTTFGNELLIRNN